MRMVFVLLAAMALTLAGCSSVNNQVFAEQTALDASIKATTALPAGTVSAATLSTIYNSQAIAATALAASVAAISAGDTSTAQIDLTQGIAALQAAASLLPPPASTTAPATTKP